MIRKTENCLYCGEKMESITAKKKYCSNKCRLYYNRERNALDMPKLEDNIKLEQVVVKNVEALELPKNDKLEMPKGLSLEERIYWMEKNK